MCHACGEWSCSQAPSVFLSGVLSQEGAFCLEMFCHQQSWVSESWMERLLKQEQILHFSPEMDWKQQTTWVVTLYKGSLALFLSQASVAPGCSTTTDLNMFSYGLWLGCAPWWKLCWDLLSCSQHDPASHSGWRGAVSGWRCQGLFLRAALHHARWAQGLEGLMMVCWLPGEKRRPLMKEVALVWFVPCLMCLDSFWRRWFSSCWKLCGAIIFWIKWVIYETKIENNWKSSSFSIALC